MMKIPDLDSTAAPAPWADAQTPHARIYKGPAGAFSEAQLAEVEAACTRIRRFEAQLLRECRAAPLIVIDPVFAK